MKLQMFLTSPLNGEDAQLCALAALPPRSEQLVSWEKRLEALAFETWWQMKKQFCMLQ